MPIFTYTAIDNAGNKRTGTVDARSQSSAVGLLKEQGLFVVGLVEQKESPVSQFLSFRGVPDTEIVASTRQLATMISAGLPISGQTLSPVQIAGSILIFCSLVIAQRLSEARTTPSPRM